MEGVPNHVSLFPVSATGGAIAAEELEGDDDEAGFDHFIVAALCSLRYPHYVIDPLGYLGASL